MCSSSILSSKPESKDCTTAVELNLISGRQARHPLRQGGQGYLAWVSASDQPEVKNLDGLLDSSSDVSEAEKKELWTLIEEYRDVFPSELPASLPPRLNNRSSHRIASGIITPVTSTFPVVKTPVG